MIPEHIKECLCDSMDCTPNELDARLKSMSVDDIMRELIMYSLGDSDWWGIITGWQQWAKQYKNEKG